MTFAHQLGSVRRKVRRLRPSVQEASDRVFELLGHEEASRRIAAVAAADRISLPAAAMQVYRSLNHGTR